jgi:capsular polysaccharide transport system permease protein
MIRELTTRYGRENIGFLWIMVEPLLFAGLVGLIWRLMKGPEEHGIGVVAFVVTGYIPITLFRPRNIALRNHFHHKQQFVVIIARSRFLIFIIVRFLIEMLGGMMAYVFIASILHFV